MRASGQSGELRYKYQVAARTGPWVIESSRVGPNAIEFTFTAEVVDSDDLWLEQQPLDLVVALGQTEWIWRDIAATITDGRMTVVLTRRPDAAGPIVM